jgi:putative FmdB family regulatory protein
MPLYEYKCEACGRRFELIRKFSDPAVEVCALCDQGPVKRLQSAPAIQFKGSGFYITDYAKQGADKGSADNAATEMSKDAKSDAAAADKGGGSETKTADTATKADAPAKSAPAAKPAAPSPAPSAPAAKD